MDLPRPLTGEPLALDLVNTAWPDAAGRHDLLDGRAGHARWLAERGLPGPTTPAARRALVQARDAIRAVLERPEDPTARRALDDVLDHGRIRVRARGDVEREAVEVPAPWRVAWLAARDVLRHLDEHPARVRACANPDCVLWFVDEARSGTRRWCSMAGCGNRLKAQRHYRRNRAPY